MRKFIITGMAVAMLAVPAVASADAPDGTPTFNPASDLTSMTEAAASKDAAIANGDNLQGWGSSALIQNGQFVSGKASGEADWQHQKGSRAELVQAELAVTGLGRNGK